jgi:hypothetical protein
VNARAAVAVLVLGAALAACSSGGNDSGSAAGTRSPAAAAGAAAATSAGTAKAVDVCTVLDAATAARLTGQPYTKAVPEKGEWQSTCAYNNDDATAQGVNVNIADTNVDSTWNLVHTGDIAEITGLGDAAFWDNDNTLYVRAGGELIQVNGLDDEGKSRALAEPVVAALR